MFYFMYTYVSTTTVRNSHKCMIGYKFHQNRTDQDMDTLHIHIQIFCENPLFLDSGKLQQIFPLKFQF